MHDERRENTMTQEEQIKEIADNLIKTLSSTMTADEADRVVKKCAKELYNEILGIEGDIEVALDILVDFKAQRNQRIIRYNFVENKK